MNQEKYCPICGELNECSMANASDSKKKESCWCFQVDSMLDRNQIPTLSGNEQGRCVCQNCWDLYQQKDE